MLLGIPFSGKNSVIFRDVIARNDVRALLDQSVVSISSFLTGVLVGRFSTKADFGLYILGYSLVLFLSGCQTSLISTPYSIIRPRLKEEDLKSFTGSTLVFQIFFATIISIGLLATSLSISSSPEHNDLALMLKVLVIAAPLMLLREYIRRFFFASMSFLSALQIDTYISATQIIFIFSASIILQLSAPMTFIILGSTCGIFSFHWIKNHANHFVIKFSRIYLHLTRNWLLGKWIFLSGIFWSLSVAMSPWIVKFLHDSSETGTLAACLGVVALGNPIIQGALNFLGPKFAHLYSGLDVESFQILVFRSVFIFCCLMLPFVFVLVFKGESVICVIYGSKYVGGGSTVAVLGVALMFEIVNSCFARGLFIIGEARTEFFVNFFSPLIVLSVGVPAVSALGTLGIGIAVLANNMGLAVAKVVLFLVLVRGQKRSKFVRAL